MKKKYVYKPKYALMDVVDVRNDIRRDWMRYSVKFAAIQERAERVELPNGRQKTLIRCCSCSGLFVRGEIQANHVHPVGKLESTDRADVEAYLARMFCKKSEIEPLCMECHHKVTAQQRLINTKNSGGNPCTSSPTGPLITTTKKTPTAPSVASSN